VNILSLQYSLKKLVETYLGRSSKNLHKGHSFTFRFTFNLLPSPIMNYLYFADCLDVLQELDHEHGGKGFIDLIYIDRLLTASVITMYSLKAST